MHRFDPLDWQKVPKGEREPGPPTDHRVAQAGVAAALQAAGFAGVAPIDAGLPHHYLVRGLRTSGG